MDNFQQRAHCEHCGHLINLEEMGPVLYHGFGHCLNEIQEPAKQQEIPFTARRGGGPVELVNGKMEVYLN